MICSSRITMIVHILQHIFGGIIQLLHEASWPLAICALALVFRESINGAIERIRGVKAGSISVLLDKMVRSHQISTDERKQLAERLTSGDFWALHTFAEHSADPKFTVPEQMNPILKVAARTLIDLGLLEVVDEGTRRRVAVTDRGNQILAAAQSLTL